MRQPENIMISAANALSQCVTRSQTGWIGTLSDAGAGDAVIAFMSVTLMVELKPGYQLIRRRCVAGYSARHHAKRFIRRPRKFAGVL